MANQNLLGSWTIRIDSAIEGVNNPHFTKNAQVTITDDAISVDGVQLASLDNFNLSPSKMHADFKYVGTGPPHTAYVQCIPGNTSSVIIGGSVVEDPETVAVWGGDDG